MKTTHAKRIIFPLSVAYSLLSLLGCSTESSSTGDDGEPVATQSMHLNARVESTDVGAAIVSIQVTDGRSVGKQYRLDGGDYFRACVDSQCKSLIDDRTQLGNYIPFFPIGYANRFAYIANTDYVLSFNRPDAANAPNSRVSLPEAFYINTPVNQQHVTDGETVIVAWTPAGSNELARVGVGADCRHTNGQHTYAGAGSDTDNDHNGFEPLYIDDVVARVRAEAVTTFPIERCEFDIQVSHERNGAVDPAFRGGYIVGVVSRRIAIVYYPR